MPTSSSSSSSSSSSYESTREIYSILLNQGHNDILPFCFIAERGFQGNYDTLPFVFKTVSDGYVNYKDILNYNNTITSNSSQEVFVPQDESSFYIHDAITHVDIISDNPFGIKQVKINNNAIDGEYVSPTYSYIIPKFSWDNDFIRSNTVSASLSSNAAITTYSQGAWIGADETGLSKIGYDNTQSSVIYTINTTSQVFNALIGSKGLYVSEYNYLSRYRTNEYFAEGDQIIVESQEATSIPNSDNDIISFYDKKNDYLYCVESYNGQVIERNAETFDIVNVYSDLDAPFKVVKANYINTLYIAGTNNIYKLYNSSISGVYSISDYKISDISCAEDGTLCVVLNSANKSVIRVLSPNLFDFKFNYILTDYKAKKCCYCGEGIFYIIAELNSKGQNYTARHYLLNYKNTTSFIADSASEMLTTTTTTTKATTSAKIFIEAPVSSEQILVGSKYAVKWASSESINDSVKIDLYDDGVFKETISASTYNTGVYEWTIPPTFKKGNKYSIKITWLSASSNTDNSDMSALFSITDSITTTTTTTTITDQNEVAAIDYDSATGNVVIILKNGLFGNFDYKNKTFIGLIDSGLRDVRCLKAASNILKKLTDSIKVRVFVGTKQYLNDKWDSGIIETDLSSSYYGGGNNLSPGETYYVNIQVYSEDNGWSDIQTTTWTMPR